MNPHDAHHEGCAIERQFFARQMNKLGDMNGLSIEQLKNELKEVRQDYNNVAS